MLFGDHKTTTKQTIGAKSSGKVNLKTENTNLVAAILGTLVLARHSQAIKAKPGQKDSARRLTELGMKQAEGLAHEVGNIDFGLVVSSPLQRAMYTTELATCYAPVPLKELGVDADDEKDPINIMFNQLGYAPLSAYFEHELAEHLKNWACTAAAAVLEVAESKAAEVGRPINMFVGGHAVSQNALLWAIAELIGEDANTSIITNMALNTQLGEAHAFIVDFAAMDGTLPTCSVIKPTVRA